MNKEINIYKNAIHKPVNGRALRGGHTLGLNEKNGLGSERCSAGGEQEPARRGAFLAFSALKRRPKARRVTRDARQREIVFVVFLIPLLW